MGSLFSFSFFFSSFLNFLAAREQLKKESEEDYQQRLRLEQETKQQLKTMKANAVGRADKELDDNVLAAREQLKKESADELKEKLAREKQTVKELATMKVLIFVCLFVVVPLLFRCCSVVVPLLVLLLPRIATASEWFFIDTNCISSHSYIHTLLYRPPQSGATK